MRALLEQAETLEREKKFAEAAAVWMQLAAAGEQQLATSGCPPLREVRLRQAGAHYQAGQDNEAIALLEALRRQTEEVEVLRLLARAYLQPELKPQRFQDAVDTARRALALDPDSVQIRHILGRAYMGLGRQSEEGSGHWQEAIDQFTDILVLFNPRDELAKQLKLQCVRKRDDAFGDTMRTQFRQFSQLIDRNERKKALEVLNELVHLVVEHAMDTQQEMPARTVQIVRDFVAMVEDYSRRSSLNLASALGSVFAHLHSLVMWVHLMNKDPGPAELSLDLALKAAPQETLPWTSKAELLYALKRGDEVAAAMNKAEALVASAHDRYFLAVTYRLLHQYDTALAWVEKVNLDTFKAEAYRPDRAERILQRLKIAIEEAKEDPEGDLEEVDSDSIKAKVDAGAKRED